MSSRLCKKLEGAVFPFQVEPLEDGVNDSIDALHVHEADHGPGSAPDLDKAALSPRISQRASEGRYQRVSVVNTFWTIFQVPLTFRHDNMSVR
jgi:hypothetical protein